ncbi:MAG: DUF4388 domain-containing protein, partial [Thermoanaerobaculia bacterium]
DSIETLLGGNPELIATGVHQWAIAEIQLQPDWRLAELFFHALKKLNDMADLQLVSSEGLAEKLREAGTLLIESCPESERQHLATILPRLGQSLGPTSSGISVLRRPNKRESEIQSGAASIGGGTAGSGELAQSLHRFSVLLSRFKNAGDGVAGAESPIEFLPQLMTLATENAQDAGEIDRHLEQLRSLGVENATPDKVISTLSEKIPNWLLESDSGAIQPPSSPAVAMSKMVSLENSGPAFLKRIREMMEVGIEHFNQGSIPRAITIFELIDRLVDEKKYDPIRTRQILEEAHKAVDTDRLRELVGRTDRHGLLRKVLNFFPAFRPAGLLALLEDDSDRLRRRLYISLVQVHGEAARPACLERLVAYSGAGDLDHRWHILRNLIHLLRHIPGELSADQLEILVELSELDHPPKLVKEALEYLGTLRLEEVEYVLMKRLYELEGHLENVAESPMPQEDIRRLMDLVAKDLIAIGTTRSRRAVVESCLKQAVYKSDASARLAAFAAHDLADEQELVEELVHRLRKELPSKFLGRMFKKGDDTVLHLVEALSGTSSPAAQDLLGEIAAGYEGQKFADVARDALAKTPAPEVEAETTTVAFSGDLDLFGVPNLLQNISDNTLSGRLVLFDKNREQVAQLYVESGSLTACSLAQLRGAEAFYQILEDPFPGTFEFSKTDTPDSPSEGGPWSMIGVLMEGMRRYDEVEMLRAVLPEDVPLKPTGMRPTPAPGEEDGGLIRSLWQQVKSGATPSQCEAAVAVDSYRARTLLAHW